MSDLISRQAVLDLTQMVMGDQNALMPVILPHKVRDLPSAEPTQNCVENALGALDCISRQAVNEIINDIRDCISVEGYWAILERLKKLPSVNPQEPKMGHWIEVIDEIDSFGNKTWHHKCSICGNENSGWGEYKYCPDCGADMRGTGND